MSDIGDALDALIDDTRDKDQEIHVQDFTREMLYREQITAMGIEVTTDRGLCADINHERVSERKAPQ